MGIFRSKPKPEPTSPKPAKNAISDRDRAQLELKRQRDRLKKYSKGMENTIAKESQIARQLLNKGEKKKAIMILKKKKMQETMLERVSGQLLNVEKLIMDIDDAVVSQQVFQALKVGSDALKAINDEMSIDDIEDILEDSAESIRIQEEISSALSTNLNQEELDDLENEVDRMFAEMAAEEERAKEQVAAPTAQTSPPETVAETTTEGADAVDEDLQTDMINALPVPSHPVAVSDDASLEAETNQEEDKKREVVLG